MDNDLRTAYRPIEFEEFVGNKAVLEGLQSVLDKPNRPHSFLFVGPSGCGKTSLAYVLKNYLEIQDSDFYKYNTANTRGIDTIREIQESSMFAPMNPKSKGKLYLLDEIHQVTGAAAESLLVMLEEPPKHVYYVLCTTDPEKLKDTLKRRCHYAELSLIPERSLKQFVKEIVDIETEDKRIDGNVFDDDVITEIAAMSNGSPGKALSYLDSVSGLKDKITIISALQNSIVSEKSVADLCKILLDENNSFEIKWKQMKIVLKSINGEPEKIRYAVSGYLAAVLLNNGTPRVANVASFFCESFMYTGKLGLVLACFGACREK